MRLSDILQPECVVVPLVAADKKAAIFALADVLILEAGIADGEAFKEAIWKRETTRTTGIGGGVAVPHGKTPSIDTLHMAIGRTAAPLEFAAIDKKPVELIILLGSPPGPDRRTHRGPQPHQPPAHRPRRRDRLKTLPTARGVYDFILELESQMA